MSADQDRIWRAILEIGTCMLVTRIGEDLRARPMQALAAPDESAVWFLSERASHKGSKVTASSRACLAFADVEDDLYVSLSGRVEMIDDPDKVASLLSDDDRSDDDERVVAGDLIALRFIPETGEIWNGWGLGGDESDADEDGAEEKIEAIVVKTGIRIVFSPDGRNKAS